MRSGGTNDGNPPETVAARPEVLQAQAARLLSLDELDELADLVIEFRANRNCGTDVASCRNLRAQATAPQSRIIAEYRAAEPELHPYARCGGAKRHSRRNLPRWMPGVRSHCSRGQFDLLAEGSPLVVAGFGDAIRH